LAALANRCICWRRFWSCSLAVAGAAHEALGLLHVVAGLAEAARLLGLAGGVAGVAAQALEARFCWSLPLAPDLASWASRRS
jgi:hypothetical protein